METTLFTKCLFEFIGTAILLLLGNGVCAACTLNKSKAKGAGWVAIALGWGFAVMCGVFVAGPVSGAHLNPAVTLGMAIAGDFEWCAVLPYVAAQMLGGFVGAALTFVLYYDHFNATTDDPDGVLGIFCTAPAIEHKSVNFLSETIATFVLVFVILALGKNSAELNLGGVGAFPVTGLIMAIGFSLGGPTGYAINPARDLSPRIAHALLPIKGKKGSNWGYAWVPVAGPLFGGCLAAATYLLIF